MILKYVLYVDTWLLFDIGIIPVDKIAFFSI